MRVERFYLFFPPAVAKFKRGETEYGIGAIPLGGFVKITGMNPDEELPPDVAPRAYYHQPVWKRIVTIAAGPAMNLLIAFLLLFVLAFGISEPTETVGEIVPGSPAAKKLEPGDRIVSVDGERGDQEALATALNEHECPGGGARRLQGLDPRHGRDRARRATRGAQDHPLSTTPRSIASDSGSPTRPGPSTRRCPRPPGSRSTSCGR